MKYKIAIASTDGKVVNQHFGRTEVFYIVEADSKDKGFVYREKRETSPVCKGQDHDDNDLAALAYMLLDCDYVLVSRIGAGARAALKKNGTEVFELPGFIEESIQRLISYIEVQKLFSEIGKEMQGHE